MSPPTPRRALHQGLGAVSVTGKGAHARGTPGGDVHVAHSSREPPESGDFPLVCIASLVHAGSQSVVFRISLVPGSLSFPICKRLCLWKPSRTSHCK